MVQSAAAIIKWQLKDSGRFLLPDTAETFAELLMKVLIKVLVPLIMFSGTSLLPTFQQGPEGEASKNVISCPCNISTSSTGEVLLKFPFCLGGKACVSTWSKL